MSSWRLALLAALPTQIRYRLPDGSRATSRPLAMVWPTTALTVDEVGVPVIAGAAKAKPELGGVTRVRLALMPPASVGMSPTPPMARGRAVELVKAPDRPVLVELSR